MMLPKENYLIPIALIERLHMVINFLYEDVMDINCKCKNDIFCKYVMIDFDSVNDSLNRVKECNINTNDCYTVPYELLQDLNTFSKAVWHDCTENKSIMINKGINFCKLLADCTLLRETIFKIWECDNIPIE